MVLLPELVDETLIHLRHDKQALRNCSLVAKSWTYPSQKLLYTDVFLTPLTYQTWQEIASPTSAKLLRHVYSLTYHQFNSLHEFHEGYLKSFHCLQCLTLNRVGNLNLDTVNSFSAFQNTLSSLSLIYVSLTLDAFIKLIGYFPKLRELRLSEPTFDSDNRTVPPPSTPPRGSLRVTTITPNILLRELCELELEYDGLEIFDIPGNSKSHTRSVISTCEKTLKHLKLYPSDSIHTLENLRELRELSFILTPLPPHEVSLISTIDSTNIRKIVFNPRLLRDLRDQFWSSLDRELSTLVDRLRALGYQHILELEVQYHPLLAEKISDAGLDGFLPKFSGKGRVTVMETISKRVLYCSDGLLGSGLDSGDSKGSETT